KLAVTKREVLRVRGDPPQTGRRDTQHWQAEVGGNDAKARMPCRDGLSQSTGAAANVEHRAAARWQTLGHDAPPVGVLAEGHQRVHEVIAAGDATEHRRDVARLFTRSRQY